MITIETEFDSQVVTLIDPDCGKELEIIVDGEGYFLRQYCDDMGTYDLIELTPKMVEMFYQSLHLPEGVFKVE